MSSSELPAITATEFGLFRELIHNQTGIALNDGKRSLVTARLAKRLRNLGLTTFTDYYRVLKAHDPGGAEMRHMINCITTNKTSFFREAEQFPILREHLRTARAEGRQSYRIWSAACSTGEEPYSLAMTVAEETPGYDVRILASDIDTDVLGRAEQGIYPLESLDGLDEQLKRRHFLRGRGELEGLVQVKPHARELVTFRRINLIEERWPITVRFDAIFCRNVIIYFDRETQHSLFERMARTLAPGGLIFVGHSENLHWMGHLLAPFRHCVYRIRE